MKYILLFTFIIAPLSKMSMAQKYSYAIDDETTSTVTNESFHRVFYEVFNLYKEEMKEFRIPVVAVPEWEKPYFTAYVAEVKGIMKFGFWGGMARIPGMNDDAVALITCHEVGHIIGGSPYIAIPSPQYKGISSEGQADYFATRYCLKKYFSQKEDTLSYLQFPSTTSEDQLCRVTSFSHWDEAICLRVANSIRGFSSVLRLLKSEDGDFSLLNNDEEVVEETIFNGYPSNQCRINTFIAGLFDHERPACWFTR